MSNDDYVVGRAYGEMAPNNSALFEMLLKKAERERDHYKSDVEVITKERDEAIRALTNIAALPTMAVDHNVVRARKIAQEALRNLEGTK